MMREVVTIRRGSDGRTQRLELDCGHGKDLCGAEVDKLAERAAKDQRPLWSECTVCDDAARGHRIAEKIKPIPIAAAKRIAEEYGYDQIVIYGRRCHDSPQPHGEHVTTYGRTSEHCRVAAMMGDTLKKLMGWQTEKDRWVEKEAMQDYNASIPPDTHNLHSRAWSELTEVEKEQWRETPRRDWEED
jgi:hypothetical protein